MLTEFASLLCFIREYSLQKGLLSSFIKTLIITLKTKVPLVQRYGIAILPFRIQKSSKVSSNHFLKHI